MFVYVAYDLVIVTCFHLLLCLFALGVGLTTPLLEARLDLGLGVQVLSVFITLF